MSDVYFVPPDDGRFEFSFDEAPVLNALNSLCLLHQDIDGISPWVDRVKMHMSDIEREMTKKACMAAGYANTGGQSSFLSWVDDVERLGTDELLRLELAQLRTKALLYLGENIPSTSELARDEETYVNTVRRLVEMHSDPFDEEETRSEYRALETIDQRRDEIVTALRTLWNRYLAEEFPQAMELAKQSAEAFRGLDLRFKTAKEAVRTVTQREQLPAAWETMFNRVKRVVFVPSAHIGPYLLLIRLEPGAVWLVSRARLPEGAGAAGPELSRSELLTRLDALSDDTRLRVLELASSEGTLTTQLIMDRLGLSQSSASRHLVQMTSTGILTVETEERTKKYRVNKQRIEELFSSLRGFLGDRE